MKLQNIFSYFSQSRQRDRNSSSRRYLLETSPSHTTGTNLLETSPEEKAGTIGNPVMNEGIVGWSDLPSDILTRVASRLELVDQIRFRAVCKSWRNIEEIKPNDEFPWIFMLNENRKPHYYLYNLRHQKLYGVSIQRLTTRMYLGSLESTFIISIKFGWLLMNPFFGKRFFLFNPFTQKLINPPKIPRDLRRHPLSTFCYCPKSKRFIIYATNSSVINGAVIIKTWKTGDRKWESHNFEAEFPCFMKKMIKMEVVGVALYCVFETGVVGCFNERRKKSWSVVVKYSEDDKLFSTVNNLFDLFSCTFEFKGELLMMDLRPFGKFLLWRLDQSKGRWVEVVEFHKCAIFLAECNPFSVFCSEQFVEPSDLVATRIYYFKPLCSSVSSMDYNRARPTWKEEDLDPLHLVNIKFPWCHEKHPSRNFPYHWIEPSLF